MFFLIQNILNLIVRPLKLLSGRFFSSQEIYQARITINFVQENIRQTYFQIHRLGIIRVVGSVIGIILLQAIPVTGLMAIEAVSNDEGVVEVVGLSEEEFDVVQTDFASDESASFSVEVSRRPIIPILNIGRVDRDVSGVTLITPGGSDIELTLDPESEYTTGRSTYENFSISEEYITTPGKYSLALTSVEDGESVTTERDFYWGVLVLNSDQDRYHPGDTAIFQMGAVDAYGVTVCHANMELVITAPDGSTMIRTTDDGSVERSEECGPTTVTHAPDYRATSLLEQMGTYTILLRAEYDGVTHTWEGSVDVIDSVPMMIRRSGPSRIWPLAEYNMNVTMIPAEDYRGVIWESIPSDFVVSQISNAGTYVSEESGNGIEWQVDWRAGETYQLSYTFDAPDVSPELFTLGPLRVGDYQESRQWLIASDAVTPNIAVDAGTATDANAQEGEGRKLVFISETTGYLFYMDSTNQVAYSKTTNGGKDWGAAVVVTTQTDCIKFSIWYDQWTPGDTTGGLIHVAFMESGTPSIAYNNIDTKNSDSQKSAAGVTAITSAGPHGSGGVDTVSVTRATNGVLYIAHTSSVSGTVGIVRKSSDTGTNWSDTADEGLDNEQLDYVMLMPLVNDDILLLRWDTSADDIQSKEYENVGDAWDGSWTNVDTNAVEDATGSWTDTWSATINPNTYDIYLAYVDNAGTASATPDVRTATYTGASWSAKTNVLTDINTILGVTIALDTLTDKIYVGYLRGTTLLNKDYYVESTDGMTTWSVERGSPTALVATNVRGIFSNLASPYEIGMWVYDDTADDVWYGSVDDIGVHSGAITFVSGTANGANFNGFESQDSHDADATSGTFSYSTGVYRSGAASLRTNPTASTGNITHTVQYAATGVVSTTDVDNCSMLVGFRIASGTNPNQQMSIIRGLGGAVVELDIALNTNQTLSIINDTDVNGSYALSDDTWYVLAITAASDATATAPQREVQMRIYSSDMSTVHEEITQNQNVLADFDQMSFGPSTASSTADLYFDDFVINCHNEQWNFPLLHNDYRIEPMNFDGTGTDTGWTNTYTNIDEIPTSTSDYIETLAANTSETSTLESASSANITGTPLAVRVSNWAWESVAATTSINGVRWRQSSTTTVTTAVDAGSTAGQEFVSIRTYPPGVGLLNWTLSDLDALEVGITNVTVETNVNRNSSTVVQALFIPSATVTVSGDCRAFNRSTTCGDLGTIKVAINGTVQSQTDTGGGTGGTFSIASVPKPSQGDTVTVFVDGAGSNSDKAVAVTKYDGSGDITGLLLYKEHLTIGSVDNQTISSHELSYYDNSASADADIFFDVTDGDLIVDDTSFSSQEVLFTGVGDTYRPGADLTTYSLYIGSLSILTTEPTATFNVSGDWENSGGTFNESTGTVNFNGATSGSLISGCSSADSCTSENFYNLTINKTDASDSNDNLTLTTNGVRVTNTVTITDGELIQGTLYVRVEGATAVSVASAGKWTNISTGDLKLGGTFTNAGTATFNSNNGTQCVDGTNDIVITSTVADTTRLWTNTGTLALYNVEADDMTDSSITAYTSDLTDAQTTWSAGSCGVTISGKAYQTNETSTINSSGAAIKAVNSYTTDTASDSDGTDGAGDWTITLSTPSPGDVIVIWFNGNATYDGTLVLEYGSSCTGYPNCTGLSLYQDRVIVRSEHTGATLTNEEMSYCDNDSGSGCADTEIGYTSNFGSTYDLTTAASRELHVWTGDTFDPNGNVDTSASSSTVHVDDSATFSVTAATASTCPTITVDTGATVTNNGTLTIATSVSGAGGLTNAATGTLNLTLDTASLTITTLTASASGNTVNYARGGAQTVRPSITYHHLTLSGSGVKTLTSVTTINGDLTMGGSATATISSVTTIGGDITVDSANTLTISANTAVNGGAIATTGTGATIASSGTPTVTLAGTGDIGGNGTSPSITFYNFTKSTSGTTSIRSNFTVTNDVTIGNTTTLGGADTSVTMTVGNDINVQLGGTLNTSANVALTCTDGTCTNGGSSSATYVINSLSTSGTGTITQDRAIRVNGDLTIGGTTTYNANYYTEVNGGDITGTGTLTYTSGTPEVQLNGVGAFGGSGNDWTFYDLNFTVTSVDQTTTTSAGAGDMIIDHELQIDSAGEPAVFRTLNAGALTWRLRGSGTPMPANGGRLNGATSTFIYEGTSTTYIGARTNASNNFYYNLHLEPVSGTVTYALLSTGANAYQITNNFSVGSGTADLTLDGTTNNPNVELGASGTWSCASGIGVEYIDTGTGTWTSAGTVNFTNCDVITATSGHTLVLSGASKTFTIAGQWIDNLTLSGTITLTNTTHNLTGNLIISNSITPGTSTINMVGVGKTIAGGGYSLYNLTINPGTTGTITLQTSDLTVTNTLTVSSSDTLAIDTGRTLTASGAADVVGPGNITGAGRITFPSGAGGPGTSITTLSAITRYDATSGDISSGTFDARTYGPIELYSTSASNRTATMNTGIYTLSGSSSYLYLYANGTGNMALNANTNNPTVSIGGNFDIPGTGDGYEPVTSGSGTWTVSGDFDPECTTFLNQNCYTASTGNTLVMDGSSKTLHTIPGSGLTLYNVSISGSVTSDDMLTVSNNLSITGTFTPAGGGIFTNLTIGNGFTNDGAYSGATSKVLFTGTAGTINGTSNTTFYDVTINPSSAGTVTLQTSDITVTNTLAISASDALTINTSRTVTHTGSTLTLTGTINGPGRLIYRSATAFPTSGTLGASLIVRMDATSNNQSLGARTDYPNIEIDNSGTTAGRTVTAGTTTSQTITITGTLSLLNSGADPSTTILQVNTYDPTLTVTGSVSIAANTTFEASSATTTNFGDDFSNSGTFNANSGTIALTTTITATIAGNTTFNNLSVTGIGAAKTIIFTNGTTQTISGTWTVTGASGQLITLQSATPSFQWTVNPTAASLSYVDISDANNTGVSICATYSQSTSGNNTNVSVSAGASCGLDISGTSNSSGGTVRVAVNGSQQAQTTTLAASWTISSVTVTTGQIVVVYVEAADGAETSGVAQYDGTGNITGMVLDTNVVSIGSDDNQTIDLTDLATWDCSDNENVMYSSSGGTLDVQGCTNSYTNPTLTVTASDTLSIGNSQTMNAHNVTVNASGILTSGTLGALNISGSWDNNGTFTSSTSTATFSSTGTETIEAGSSSFYAVVINNASGSWTIQTNNLTATNDVTLTAATAFTLASGVTLEVQGNYSQAIAAANTTWTGSTLYLNGSGGMYDINTKTHGGDTYATLRIGASEDIAMWDSSAGTYTIDSGGCLFSEDHSATAGRLNLYGTCNSRANEYWSYATDFDGTALGGSSRQAQVQFAPSATLAIDDGDTLAIIGQNATSNRTSITRQSTGNYGLDIDGTINAQYFDFDYLDANGLRLSSHAVVTELSDGSFDNNASGASSSYITIASAATSKQLFRLVFDDSADGADSNVVYNVNADGSGVDWMMLQWSGAKGGEANDTEINGAAVQWFSDLTLAVSAQSIDLGVVNPLITGSGNHTITVTSNAPSGYTCRAAEDGNLRNGAHDIDDVADGTVTTGSEEYGISCTGADCQLSGDNAITGSPLTIATYNATAVARVTTLYYKAAISAATAGLPYSHVVTITCSGDF